MPATSPHYQDLIVEDHSDRLGKLEDGVSEIKVAQAVNTKTLENISEKIDVGFQDIKLRLDDGQNKFESHAAQLHAHKEELAKLQASAKARKARYSAVRKAAFGLALAGLGAAVAKGGEAGWAWVAALFGG